MTGVQLYMSQWSSRTGWRIVNIDLDIIVFLFFRYFSFVREVLIVITWVVMLGTFIIGQAYAWSMCHNLSCNLSLRFLR